MQGRIPKVLNKRHGNILDPEITAYIGRGSPWGNPFVIGVDGTRQEVCDRYEKEILPNLDLEPLRGKDLLCYCVPHRCHGHSILKELIRRYETNFIGNIGLSHRPAQASYGDRNIMPASPAPNKRFPVLITGGRDYNDMAYMGLCLNTVKKHLNPNIIIHGGARGADTLAGQWAAMNNLPVEVYGAEWDKHGKSAGFIRNREMLQQSQPYLVVGFAGGKGTNHMLNYANEQGFPVWNTLVRHPNNIDWEAVKKHYA